VTGVAQTHGVERTNTSLKRNQREGLPSNTFSTTPGSFTDHVDAWLAYLPSDENQLRGGVMANVEDHATFALSMLDQYLLVTSKHWIFTHERSAALGSADLFGS